MNSLNLSDKNKEKENQIKFTDLFANIKSDNFFLKLFDNIKQKKKLEINKYNKSLKKRLNLNINDYKEYSEIYSSIEIEIIPAKNKYGKFINFDNEEAEEGEEVEEGEIYIIIYILMIIKKKK